MSERLYRIHVAAQLVGVSENLLRAWERRYRVVEPRRSPKGYRGYTPGDVELLRRVRQLTQEGVAIGDVVPLLPRLRREVREGLAPLVPAPRSDASGRAEQWVDALLAAVAESSQQKIDAVLDEALAALPALQVHEAVMMPAEREVGDRWHRGELSVAQEHLLSNAVRERLVTLVHGAPRPTGRHAICACFPEEQHELGLLGAALRFRHEGWRVTYLGARVPLEHLAEITSRLQPELVALSLVSDPGAAQVRRVLSRLVKGLPRGTRIVMGGQGALAHRRVLESLGIGLAGPAFKEATGAR